MQESAMMNKQIIRATQVQMTRKGHTQSSLAEKTGFSRQHINRMLKLKEAVLPDSWEAIFKELGLKLVAVPDDFPVPEEEKSQG